jgi:DNA-directed DNA polymerase III PolC
MLINMHSYYSLRYGTLSPQQLCQMMLQYGYHTAVLTDINNSSGFFQFLKLCRQHGLNGLAGMELRHGDELLYIGIARNAQGFKELNELVTQSNLLKQPLPRHAPPFQHVYVVYPYGSQAVTALRDNEYIGIQPQHRNKILNNTKAFAKYVIWHPVSFANKAGFNLHCQLRAISHNILLSQLQPGQRGGHHQRAVSKDRLLQAFADFPQLIHNTTKLLSNCSFDFDFKEIKNKKTFTGNAYDDKLLLEKLALEGMKYRYGKQHKEALQRVHKELDIIDKLGFSSYFLITWDIVRYAMQRGFYHVGRGSGANSVVAYCLKITDVCPIELDLYFERFLNPKRKSPPDFDIDFSWDERDDVYDYIFKRYGHQHVALMGAMSTFRDSSIIRELGKVYGLPKGDIDRMVNDPTSALNRNEVCDMIMNLYKQMEDFPNLRTIHSSGVMVSELPITSFTALDMPPKGFQTAQIDMYTAEDIGFEKFDILSQRGIGHIKECADIVEKNRGIKIDAHRVHVFKEDAQIKAQLKKGDTIGCFYVESPAMRGLLKKLRCDTYLVLVAASSIIRPGVARSGMMQQYIRYYQQPHTVQYLHPIMEQQLKETFGVMVYQEDVLKVGHHFGGLDLADADVLRRMMSGKSRNAKHLKEIEGKYYAHCQNMGYSNTLAKEVWRQIESFAGYSFSKAHSASFAVESFQSLYLKTYYPIEFMVAVINNFGGFYRSWVYFNEARKAGATLHLPCINKSNYHTVLYGNHIYTGFVFLKSIEANWANALIEEREKNGPYSGLEDLMLRLHLPLDQCLILIRAGALRCSGKTKKALLWQAHTLSHSTAHKDAGSRLFYNEAKHYALPQFEETLLEDAYDEIELMGWSLSLSAFDMLRNNYRGDIIATQLNDYVDQTVRITGQYVAMKPVMTIKRQLMAFGTFLDVHGNFFDTTHFPPTLAQFPFKGHGVYLIQGKVVQEFGFASIEVEKMAKLPIKPDPRST